MDEQEEMIAMMADLLSVQMSTAVQSVFVMITALCAHLVLLEVTFVVERTPCLVAETPTITVIDVGPALHTTKEMIDIDKEVQVLEHEKPTKMLTSKYPVETQETSQMFNLSYLSN